jgi:hypothetical protein
MGVLDNAQRISEGIYHRGNQNISPNVLWFVQCRSAQIE